MSLERYATSFLLRSGWSLLIVALSCAGLGVVVDNLTGNNFTMARENRQFEIVYFSGTAATELLSAIIYMTFFFRQRGVQDLNNFNMVDCRCTCFFTFIRIGFTIALSIFMLIEASRYTSIRHYENMRPFDREKIRDWTALEKITGVILGMEIAYFMALVCGLMYQPENFERSPGFDVFTTIPSRPIELPQEDIEDSPTQ